MSVDVGSPPLAAEATVAGHLLLSLLSFVLLLHSLSVQHLLLVFFGLSGLV